MSTNTKLRKGIYAVNNETITSGTYIGTISFTSFENDNFAMSETMYSIIPTGGVAPPIVKINTDKTPNCIGSIPTCSATGVKIGAKTTIASEANINKPIINKKTTIIVIITVGLVEKLNKKSAKVSETPDLVTTQAKLVAEAIINKIFAES